MPRTYLISSSNFPCIPYGSSGYASVHVLICWNYHGFTDSFQYYYKGFWLDGYGTPVYLALVLVPGIAWPIMLRNGKPF
ncbi:hypothetical protein [Algoriphagus sp.]|uniref:hypothetical protein n=1 Tax=Algoriphagus sp. TaxID=1872435 RepID=UPI0025EBB200|nr:hypothetical protein [Algoriphagus sp.]